MRVRVWFTKDEFDIMVNELLYKNPVSFDMLCQIAEKTLRSRVTQWCHSRKEMVESEMAFDDFT